MSGIVYIFNSVIGNKLNIRCCEKRLFYRKFTLVFEYAVGIDETFTNKLENQISKEPQSVLEFRARTIGLRPAVQSIKDKCQLTTYESNLDYPAFIINNTLLTNPSCLNEMQFYKKKK